MPVFGLVIVHHEARVDDARHPAKQGEEKTQDEAENPPGHQDGDWRKDDTEEVAQGFQKK